MWLGMYRLTSVAGFHRSRRMFLIKDGKVVIGPEKTSMSHLEWFNSIGLDGKKTVRESVRGFVDGRGLFFYRGEDFTADNETENTLLGHLTELARELELPPHTQVYAGVIKTAGTTYPPKKKLGTIGDLTH